MRATLAAHFPRTIKVAARVARMVLLARFLRSFVRFTKPFLPFLWCILGLLHELLIALIIQEFPFKINDLWN